MTRLDQIKAEWETIRSSVFWLEYTKEIKEYRGRVSRDCETFPKDKVEKSQGEIIAIDRISKVPEKILSAPSETITKENR